MFFFEIFRIYENLWNFRFSVEFRMKFSVFRSVFVEYSFSGFLVSMFCLGTDYIYRFSGSDVFWFRVFLVQMFFGSEFFGSNVFWFHVSCMHAWLRCFRCCPKMLFVCSVWNACAVYIYIYIFIFHIWKEIWIYVSVHWYIVNIYISIYKYTNIFVYNICIYICNMLTCHMYGRQLFFGTMQVWIFNSQGLHDFFPLRLSI